MSAYLLDTNACIALINGGPLAVRKRFERAVAEYARIATSSITVYELWYGVAKSAKRDANARRLDAFLSQGPEILPFESDDAAAAGSIRAVLERAGTPIGAYDTLIAAQAIRLGIVLVTANVREFGRVPNLRFEDWTAISMRDE